MFLRLREIKSNTCPTNFTTLPDIKSRTIHPEDNFTNHQSKVNTYFTDLLLLLTYPTLAQSFRRSYNNGRDPLRQKKEEEAV